MGLKSIKQFFILLGCLVYWPAWAQATSEGFQVVSRLNYYMNEPDGELLVLAQDTGLELQTVSVLSEGQVISKSLRTVKAGVWLIGLGLTDLPNGTTELLCSLVTSQKKRVSTKVSIQKLPFQANAVQVDRMTGGVWTDGQPFFPLGFYTYSPVQPTLAEEEAARGFNMMSPYQEIKLGNRAERKAYLDRAAALGMKVHFNLLSVAGGGGIHSEKVALNDPAKMRLLREEIEAFKKHPALLAWYLSDEPSDVGIEEATLRQLYTFIKQLDPYHPVSIVFNEVNRPKEYRAAMDIVMVDPYPIPQKPITQVQDFTQALKTDFAYEKPVWVVPQAFGGNEWWQREPSRAELRAMSYLAVLNGAMGLQYFVRHGLASFPKSLDLWNEAGTVAKEMADFSPFFFSSEPAPQVTSDTPAIQIRAWQFRNQWLIVVVNTENKPKSLQVRLPHPLQASEATVLFANRTVALKEQGFEDMLDAFGTRAYLVQVDRSLDDLGLVASNLMQNPSFEENPNVGTPDGFYARLQGDRAALLGLDTRVVRHGRYALRTTTLKENQGLRFQFFPTLLWRDKSYLVSIWAKGDRNLGQQGGSFQLKLAETTQTFTLTNRWQRYVMTVRLPEDSVKFRRESLELTLKTAGTAWFDLVQVHPDPEIITQVDPETETIQARVFSVMDNALLRYTLDGSPPTVTSPAYNEALALRESAMLRAAVFFNGNRLGQAQKSILIHKATAKKVAYSPLFSSEYAGGNGLYSLVDGETASAYVRDPHWQGFLGDDLNVTLDLGQVTAIQRISISFLKDYYSWVFAPLSVAYEVSTDGITFRPLSLLDNPQAMEDQETNVQRFSYQTQTEARFVRVRAKSVGVCPPQHPGAGGKAWLFADEIVVE